MNRTQALKKVRNEKRRQYIGLTILGILFAIIDLISTSSLPEGRSIWVPIALTGLLVAWLIWRDWNDELELLIGYMVFGDNCWKGIKITKDKLVDLKASLSDEIKTKTWSRAQIKCVGDTIKAVEEDIGKSRYVCYVDDFKFTPDEGMRFAFQKRKINKIT